jgi:hypothetical protein
MCVCVLIGIIYIYIYYCLMYWTADNLQDICVNRPSATLHEDGVMAPKLPIEHRVDDNRTFLTTLNKYYIYIYVYIYIQSPY